VLETLCGYGLYSRKRVLEWFRRLRDAREHPKISLKGEIFINVRELVDTNCQMTLNPIEDKLYLPGNNSSCFSRSFVEEKDLSEVSSTHSHG